MHRFEECLAPSEEKITLIRKRREKVASSFHSRQRNECSELANRSHRSLGNPSQVLAQSSVAIVCVQFVVSTAQKVRNKVQIGVIEDDRDRFGVERVLEVDPVDNQKAFGLYPFPGPGLLFELESAMVGFGANGKDELCLLEHPNLPTRPSFRRKADDELIDNGIEAVFTEAIAQRKNTIFVVRRIVTVADKDFGMVTARREHLPRPV